MSNNQRIIGPSLRPWIDYMKDLSNSPNPKTVAALESVMDKAKDQTILNTHVVSGRLAGSIAVYSDVRRTTRISKYEAEISIGQGLDYAGEEVSRKDNNPRMDWPMHPGHDMMDNLEYWYAEVDAILNTLMDK